LEKRSHSFWIIGDKTPLLIIQINRKNDFESLRAVQNCGGHQGPMRSKGPTQNLRESEPGWVVLSPTGC
jgi:hypothetical protein